MKREELLKIAKPIVLKTWEVQAILDNRKTSIRRVIKDKDIINSLDCEEDGTPVSFIDRETGDRYSPTRLCPYLPHNILFVKETFLINNVYGENGILGLTCVYRVDNEKISIKTKDWNKYTKWGKFFDKPGWCSSIYMPQDFTRIFLRVIDIRVEKIQNITENGVFLEGIQTTATFQNAKYVYRDIWNGDIKPKDRALYGWDANPYVFVIEFERIEVGD